MKTDLPQTLSVPRLARRAAAIAALVLALALLTACNEAPQTLLPAVTTTAVIPDKTSASSSATPMPQVTPTIQPTQTPSPEIGQTIVILHTNDVFGQMDPCG